jgi:hypothetical protein
MEVATAGDRRRGEAVAGLLNAWPVLNLVWAAALVLTSVVTLVTLAAGIQIASISEMRSLKPRLEYGKS